MREVPRLATLAGAVLIGGASRRLGRPKQLLTDRAGRTLVERAVATLAPFVDEVALAGQGEVPPALARLPRIADVFGARGPIAGLLGLFAVAADHAWLAVACDLPWLDEATLAWLLGERRGDRIAVVPRRDAGGLETLTAVWEPAVAPVLRRLAASGRGSLQPLAEDPRVATPRVPDRLARAFADVDDEETWSRFLAADADDAAGSDEGSGDAGAD
ncbi:MAG: molybdenum cofactor guanylyltransferase [Thermoanaerobaculia bacterium]